MGDMPASQAKQAVVAARRADALDRRMAGQSLRQIAAALDYKQASHVAQDIRRALDKATADQALSAAQFRTVELGHLDHLRAQAADILAAVHYAHSGGKLIENPDGAGFLSDSGPKLHAIRVLLTLAERKARLLGIDAPTAVTADTTVRYEIVGVDPASFT